MMKTLLVLSLALSLAGCASDYNKYAAMQTSIHVAHANAEAERFKAMGRIAATGDTTTKVAAMFAMQVSAQQGQQPQIAAPRSPMDTMMQALGIFVPAIVQGYGIHANQQVQTTQSNNATTLGISTNESFVGIAGKIQAPAPNVTLSGSGVIGNGGYSTDTHAISGSYNPIDNSNQPIDNSRWGSCTTGNC